MFHPDIAICREDGGGGNRTRVGFQSASPGHAALWVRRLQRELRDLLAENGPRSRVSNVYAIGVPERYVKIGLADNPQGRLKELQVGNPEDLTLLAYLRGPIGWESYIHEELAGTRIRGEWFEWTEQVEGLVEAFRAGI